MLIQKKNKVYNVAVKSIKKRVDIPENWDEIVREKAKYAVDFSMRSMHHTLTALFLLLEATNDKLSSPSSQEKMKKFAQSFSLIKEAVFDWNSFVAAIGKISKVKFFFLIFGFFHFTFLQLRT